MSTRCQIIIKDVYDSTMFYRHCDGYPEGVMPSLQKFMSWVRSGKIRDNVGQAAGWLILLGAIEYDTQIESEVPAEIEEHLASAYRVENVEDPQNWKCGSFEPAPDMHGDIEFLYVLDLNSKIITCFPDFSSYEDQSDCIFTDTAENPWHKQK